jgi:hypothetical protein
MPITNYTLPTADLTAIGLTGKNLIFLISQPRAGSTMTQRILGSHSTIHTTTEPWVMLYPIYALRRDEHQANYNALWAWVNTGQFLETLPNGQEEYRMAIRYMGAYLYSRALANSNKRYFLDKTPRYYFIIPELAEIYPEAKYIILLRNPLAVLCSMINAWILKTWRKGNWFALAEFRYDLLEAPQRLLDGIETLGEKAVVIRYEDLVHRPDQEIAQLCAALKIDFEPEMVQYGRQNLPRWPVGDQDGVYQHPSPQSARIDGWVQSLAHPQVWRLARDYLHRLGPKTIDEMGYSYETLNDTLERHRPHRVRQWFTLPLAWVVREKLFRASELVRLSYRKIKYQGDD